MAHTYLGHVRTPQDATLLFEACRLGILPRIQRRLSDRERAAIRTGSVFVWDEKEAGMRRWTDGKSWSASRVSGSFLTYREMEGKRSGPNSNGVRISKGSQSGSEDSDDMHEGVDIDGYKYKADGLVKQSFSITTSEDQKLHLISYFARSDPASAQLQAPSTDSALAHITIPRGLYPEVSSHESPEHRHVSDVRRSSGDKAPPLQPRDMSYHSSLSNQHGHFSRDWSLDRRQSTESRQTFSDSRRPSVDGRYAGSHLSGRPAGYHTPPSHFHPYQSQLHAHQHYAQHNHQHFERPDYSHFKLGAAPSTVSPQTDSYGSPVSPGRRGASSPDVHRRQSTSTAYMDPDVAYYRRHSAGPGSGRISVNGDKGRRPSPPAVAPRIPSPGTDKTANRNDSRTQRLPSLRDLDIADTPTDLSRAQQQHSSSQVPHMHLQPVGSLAAAVRWGEETRALDALRSTLRL
ncbi:Gluconate transport-inducing protein [Savitreella phatthalungensis]